MRGRLLARPRRRSHPLSCDPRSVRSARSASGPSWYSRPVRSEEAEDFPAAELEIHAADGPGRVQPSAETDGSNRHRIDATHRARLTARRHRARRRRSLHHESSALRGTRLARRDPGARRGWRDRTDRNARAAHHCPAANGDRDPCWLAGRPTTRRGLPDDAGSPHEKSRGTPPGSRRPCSRCRSGRLGHLYLGGLLPFGRSYRHLGPNLCEGFSNHVCDPIPLAYPTSGTGDFRVPALVVVAADGSTALAPGHRSDRITAGEAEPCRVAIDLRGG